MNDSAQHPKCPSKKQLDYLKALAEKTGGSFAWPTTSRQASEEIMRLQSQSRTPSAERRRERRQVQDDIARGSGGAVRVRNEELCGYSSTAQWAGSK